MDKKKLPLEKLKVKSFVTVMNNTEQKTVKGGIVDISDKLIALNDNWTTIKTQKTPFLPDGNTRLRTSSTFRPR